MSGNFYHASLLLLTLIGQSISPPTLHAQVGYRLCETVEYNEWLRQQHPGLHGSEADFERWISEKIAIQQHKRSTNTTIRTIPVIFHIFHDLNQAIGVGSNITAAQVQSQIDILNEDFRRTGNGFNNHPAGTDCLIEFCLALVDENGNTLAEPGILRWSTWGNGPFSRSYIDASIKPPTSQDPSRFLNYWVVDMPLPLYGYAQFPNMSGLTGLNSNNGTAATDGVVVASYATGAIGSAAAPYDLGRTATHEVGHWLGLRHLWGDGDCKKDDFCTDTPPCANTFFAEHPTCQSIGQCGFTRMIENYMDYSDDGCMNIFTNQQKARMDAVLGNSPNRPYSETVPTVCHPFILANIKHNPGTIRSCSATTINLVNQPEMLPSAVQWSFSGAGVSPTNSTSVSPMVTVNTTGTLTVSLEAFYATIHESQAKQISIIILPPNNSACQAPTCFDGILNGNETGIDCGGDCAKNCNPLCDEALVYNGPFQLTGQAQAATLIEAGSIIGDGEVITNAGENISLQAGDQVILHPGFNVSATSVFEIQMTGCN